MADNKKKHRVLSIELQFKNLKFKNYGTSKALYRTKI